MSIIVKNATLSYPAVFEPKENLSGVLKYSCSLLIPKTDKAGIAVVEAAIAAAIEKGKSTVWGGKVPKFRYEALRDGDAELASGDKDDPVYKGKVFLNCSSNDAPGVVGPDAAPLMDQARIYAGCEVHADVNPFPYKNGGNCGVGWGFNNLMLVGDGKRLDGRKSADDAFAGLGAEPEEATEGDLK